MSSAARSTQDDVDPKPRRSVWLHHQSRWLFAGNVETGPCHYLTVRTRLSFVLVVWGDYSKYLDQALKPISELPNTQIILLDNGSDRPLLEDSRYELKRSSERLSAGAARNLAMDGIDSEFLCFIDVDDQIIPSFVNTAIAELDKSSAIGFTGTLLYSDSETMQPTGKKWPARRWDVLTRSPSLLASYCLFKNVVPIGGGIFRTEAVRRAGGFADQHLHEDWTLSVVLALQGRIHFSDIPAVLYRIHNDSKSRRPHQTSERAAARARVRKQYLKASMRPWWGSALLPFAYLYHRYTASR